MNKYYYISDDKIKFGPFSLEDLIKEPIHGDTLVWYEGLDEWTPASEVINITILTGKLPPKAPTFSNKSNNNESNSGSGEKYQKNNPPQVEVKKKKSSTQTIVLIIFLILLVISGILLFSKSFYTKPSNNDLELIRQQYVKIADYTEKGRSDELAKLMYTEKYCDPNNKNIGQMLSFWSASLMQLGIDFKFNKETVLIKNHSDYIDVDGDKILIVTFQSGIELKINNPFMALGMEKAFKEDPSASDVEVKSNNGITIINFQFEECAACIFDKQTNNWLFLFKKPEFYPEKLKKEYNSFCPCNEPKQTNRTF